MTTTDIKEVLERLERIEAMLAAPAPAREYLSVEEAAEFLGLSKGLLDEWRARTGGGPAYHKLGRSVRYSVTDLKAFAAESRMEALR